jgi:hypothetical protein
MKRQKHADRRTSLPVSLMLVLLLAAGCGTAASGGQAAPSPEESMSTDLPASPAPAGLECGAPFEPTTGGILTVTGRFPTAVSASEQMVTGTVVVAANGSEARGVVTPQAEAFLVRDGRVVTLPMPQDSVGRKLALRDGKVQRMPTMATLVACSGGEVLPTGTYDLYVRVVLNLDDGSRADSIGGPWPLEVR